MVKNFDNIKLFCKARNQNDYQKEVKLIEIEGEIQNIDELYDGKHDKGYYKIDMLNPKYSYSCEIIYFNGKEIDDDLTLTDMYELSKYDYGYFNMEFRCKYQPYLTQAFWLNQAKSLNLTPTLVFLDDYSFVKNLAIEKDIYYVFYPEANKDYEILDDNLMILTKDDESLEVREFCHGDFGITLDLSLL